MVVILVVGVFGVEEASEFLLFSITHRRISGQVTCNPAGDRRYP
jgi:hypothetical protein